MERTEAAEDGGYSGGRLPGRSTKEKGREEGEVDEGKEERRIKSQIVKDVIADVDLPFQNLAQVRQYRDIVTCLSAHNEQRLVKVVKVQIICTRSGSIVMLLPPTHQQRSRSNQGYQMNQRCTIMTNLNRMPVPKQLCNKRWLSDEDDRQRYTTADIQKKAIDEGTKDKAKRTGAQSLVQSWDCSQIDNEAQAESRQEVDEMVAEWDEEQKLVEILERREGCNEAPCSWRLCKHAPELFVYERLSQGMGVKETD